MVKLKLRLFELFWIYYGLVVQLFDLLWTFVVGYVRVHNLICIEMLWICCGLVEMLWICCTTCGTANPQQTEQVEFELKAYL
jgi:hypothetical protein